MLFNNDSTLSQVNLTTMAETTPIFTKTNIKFAGFTAFLIQF